MKNKSSEGKGVKQFICGLLGHKFSKWIWAEELDYALRYCEKCNKQEWGCTKGYFNKFNKQVDLTDYKIIHK